MLSYSPFLVFFTIFDNLIIGYAILTAANSQNKPKKSVDATIIAMNISVGPFEIGKRRGIERFVRLRSRRHNIEINPKFFSPSCDRKSSLTAFSTPSYGRLISSHGFPTPNE